MPYSAGATSGVMEAYVGPVVQPWTALIAAAEGTRALGGEGKGSSIT